MLPLANSIASEWLSLIMLALQLPAVQAPDGPDRAGVVALRAAIRELITEITIGPADPT